MGSVVCLLLSILLGDYEFNTQTITAIDFYRTLPEPVLMCEKHAFVQDITEIKIKEVRELENDLKLKENQFKDQLLASVSH